MKSAESDNRFGVIIEDGVDMCVGRTLMAAPNHLIHLLRRPFKNSLDTAV